MPYESIEYRNTRERYRPVAFEECPLCGVTRTYPLSQPRECQCQRVEHHMVWWDTDIVTCAACDWVYVRPRGVLGDAVREAHRVAHKR